MGLVVGEHVARFCAVIARDLGLAFEEERLGQLSEVLGARVATQGGDVERYLERLERGGPHESWASQELSSVARQVTIAETYFFRHRQQFDALRAILSSRSRASAPPRLLSAGCASGEEAYSLVMLMREIWPDREPLVVAADLNPAILERALEARYSAWSLRETSEASIARWFRKDGRDYVVDDAIRRSVRFVRANLASDDAELLAPGSFDLIFCRNVLMYFTPENFRAAVGRLSRALVPAGYLFLGSAETLRGISQEFHLCHTHEAFYYQRKRPGELSRHPPRLEPREGSRHEPPEAAPSFAWADEISRAAARITALTRDGASAELEKTSPPSRKYSDRSAIDLSAVLDLLHREQFSDALDQVRGLPDAARDPEAMLLEAVLLASRGDFAEADEVCQRLLQLDELNAGAHYVLALCNAGAGRRDRSVHHDRVAVYLDPGFAMPRLHLGLMLRREGDRKAARVELGHARSLLEREDAARLLMFGGGFNRGALLALCSTELELTGGDG
jgi:chemotaxis protein methyltransferase CheR